MAAQKHRERAMLMAAPTGVVSLPRLRAAREARLITQEELAQKAGVSRFTVARTERGEPARYSTVRKLAEALEVEPATLMAPSTSA